MLQVGEEARAIRSQRLQHLAGLARELGLWSTSAPLDRCQCASASRSQSTMGVPRTGPLLRLAGLALLARPPPHDAAGRAEPVQHLRCVVLDAHRQHVVFPGRCRRGIAFELAQHLGQRDLALAALVALGAGKLVPAEQEAHELRRRHRPDLGAQLVARVAVHARQQAAVAPLLDIGRAERAAHHGAFGFERIRPASTVPAPRPSGAPSAAASTGPSSSSRPRRISRKASPGSSRSLRTASMGGDSLLRGTGRETHAGARPRRARGLPRRAAGAWPGVALRAKRAARGSPLLPQSGSRARTAHRAARRHCRSRAALPR